MKRVAAVAALVLVVACGGQLHDVVDAHNHGDGTTRIVAASSARAWELAHDVCRSEGAETFDDHQTEGYFLAQINARTFPPRYGAYIGVWIAPSGADHATVTAVTKRTEATWGKGLTEGTLLEELTKRAATPPPAAAPPASGGS